MSGSSLARAATRYAAKQWPVFPLIPRDKKPLTEHGLKDASVDKIVVGDWWEKEPSANIGVVMGDASGLFTIDIDGDDGRADWAAIEAKQGAVPSTVEAETSNGRHLIFKKPPDVEIRNSASKIGRNIDVRGTGGYIVVAPSIHPSGREYRWKAGHRPDQIEPAEAPAWLIELVRKHEAPAPPPNGNHRLDSYASAALADELAAMASTPEGRRNDQLNCSAFNLGTLIGAGLIDRGTVERALTGAAAAGGLPLDEINKTIKSGLEAGIAKPRAVPESGFAKPFSSSKESPSPAAEQTWPELDPAARHGFVGRLLEVIEPHTEADTAALIGQFLAAFGIAVGRGPHAMVEATRHGTNLFVAIVGDSSKARKGTAYDQVDRLVRQADSTWSERTSSGLSTGEGLIHVVRDPIEKQQPIKVQGKVTGYEKVIEDPGVADKRILVIESELASVLKVATREGNTISPLLRAAWDGKTLRTMTRNSPLKATDPHVGVIGHITRLEVQRLLTETEAGNGLGNRILWLCARRSKLLPDGGYVDPIAVSDLTTQLAGIIQTAKTMDRLRRNAEATTAWRAVYPALSEGKIGLLGALTNRGEAQVLRLSMLYALLDRSPEIRIEHLRAALALWEYAERSAAFIFGDSLGDPVADMIWSALKASSDGLTRTELSALFARHRGSEQLDRALRSLQPRARPAASGEDRRPTE